MENLLFAAFVIFVVVILWNNFRSKGETVQIGVNPPKDALGNPKPAPAPRRDRPGS